MDGILVAKVAIAAATYSIDKPYDYALPASLAEKAAVGMRVMVPFGRGNRRSEGMILVLSPESKVEKLKTVISLLDQAPVLDKNGIKLALWLRERYFCTLYEAIKTMLPAGLWFSLNDTYKIADGVEKEAAYEAAVRSKSAVRLLDILYANGGETAWTNIRAAFGEDDPSPAAKLLVKKNIISSETHAMRAVGDKTVNFASLAVPAEEAIELVAKKKNSAPLRYAVVELLACVGSASVKEICYFTGASAATVRSLQKSGILTMEPQEVLRRPYRSESVTPGAPILLNPEQRVAFEGIDVLCRNESPSVSLLTGVTGSGKTLVYIKLLERVLERGKTAIVLVPEIALTPQLMNIFSSYFSDRIALLHSSLRIGQRYDEWKRIRSGRVSIVVGTRSAIFAPLQNLGLIVIDEEQEYTYKSENIPRYHARDVAKFRCVQDGALLLLGSATPAVESTYSARTGAYHSFSLPHRFNEKQLPRVMIADMREQLKAGNGSTISSVLRGELEANIHAGQQSILFINRRGNSRMVVCGECGSVPECPRCSVPLTYHSVNNRLMCHYCGHSERLSDTCTQCGGAIKFIGAGTQKVQQELSSLFPDVEILRMDTDTVSAACPHEALLDRFVRQRVPILVGTQMVAKGLDFENVTLVGVIAAELSLYIDNYRARERTFSLLTQVIGRAGRGDKTGRAVIQTFTPENEVIQLAAAQDHDGFYESEIGLRRIRGCPPFADLFTLTVTGIDEENVVRGCLRLRMTLEELLRSAAFEKTELTILGPAAAPVTKINNRYRYRLTLVCRNDKPTRRLLGYLLKSFRNDKCNKGLSVFADSNSLE